KRDKIAEMVAKHNDVALRFFVLVHGVDTVEIKLKEGHPFFSTLFEKGEILFQNNMFPLPVPGQSVPMSVSSMEDYWTGRYELATHFYQAATHAAAEGWNDQAIFMLHQAVEHTCIALIKVYLGYRVT